ncbi:PAS/PAC sensor signal transduction histidine kinase [Hymenobacter roseosalivarius DSM 11622]|uniref:PAS/PAC sensor signal transduction histidine kinase n=1 Tax=Hymenobacter roseosalivarius DSM 11622 TaxID=645990 RepID=A0A1W1W280_9BACT|nr:PAS domain-containing sensor histidine kinase [Hymenobacter roseosalivarius]SMB99696.1 PAS/PAC sensor signal transduction histidine kinase [Hymenobacter roseosalivarius DSM 11622]
MSDIPYSSELFETADAEIRSLREENRQLRTGRTAATARQADSDDYERSQVRFRTVFENSALGQKIIAPDLTIHQANPAVVAMLGYARPAELLGQRILDIAHPDHWADWHELQRQLWTHRRPNFTLETRLVRANGTTFWCQVTSVLFPDDGAELGYTILEDISARKAAEQAVLRLERTQQQQLAHAVLAAQEAERARIAEDLHNGLGQLLCAVQLQLDQVAAQAGAGPLTEQLRPPLALLQTAIRQTRTLSHQLIPLVLQDFGLAAALHDIGQTLSLLRLRCVVGKLPVLPQDLSLALYRMAQELAHNIVQHADAGEATLRLSEFDGWLELVADDDGRGFEPEQPRPPSLGLNALRDRVRLLNGELTLTSAPGEGTHVLVRIPGSALAAEEA